MRVENPRPKPIYYRYMRLESNGDGREVANVSTLIDFVEQLAMKLRSGCGITEARNCSSCDWEATTLKDGDELEIVHFVGDG